MQIGEVRDLRTTTAFLARAFLVGMALWVVSSVILAVPHGPGHSIESMTPLVVIRDAAFPVWLGAFVAILAALALKAVRSIETR